MSTSKATLTKDGIRLYEPSDFAGMHKAGRLAASNPATSSTLM